jgi:methylmalonyl-CoA carboxyltransferase large subunit
MNEDQRMLRLMADRMEDLLHQMRALHTRIDQLEQELKTHTQPAANAPLAEEEVPDEIALVIAAAVAAFLGARPRVRQIRLVGSTAWTQQGRVSIQASHGLVHQHG